MSSMDFGKMCRIRIKISAGVVFLGALAILAAQYLEGGPQSPATEFYICLGLGLMGGGMVKIIKNRNYLKNPDLKKRQEIFESDERNRELGLRCWAYSGYAMFLLLYLGILTSGFFNLTVAKTLLTVAGVHALLLIIFRMALQKRM